MTYTSSKVIELGSTAFRQPNADSHCRFVHGYQLKAELTFGCNELDKNNWVYDFGGLKDLKATFNNQFDHTLVVASNDPLLDIFKALNEAGGANLRIMDGGVGIERFAEWCFKTADTYIVEVKEQEEEVPESKELPLEQQQQQPEQPPSKGARVGPNVTQGNFSDPFAGTTWGNK